MAMSKATKDGRLNLKDAENWQIHDVLYIHPDWSGTEVWEHLIDRGIRASMERIAGIMSSRAKKRRKEKATAGTPAAEAARVSAPAFTVSPSMTEPPPCVAAFILLPVVARLGGVAAVRKALDELESLLKG